MKSKDAISFHNTQYKIILCNMNYRTQYQLIGRNFISLDAIQNQGGQDKIIRHNIIS